MSYLVHQPRRAGMGALRSGLAGLGGAHGMGMCTCCPAGLNGVMRPMAGGALMGLGDAAAVDTSSVTQALSAMVASAQQNTQAIVARVGFVPFTSNQANAQAWADNIMNPILVLQQKMLATDASGLPFFVRFPDTARSLMQQVGAGAAKDISDFAANANLFGVSDSAIRSALFGFGAVLNGLFEDLLAAMDATFQGLADSASKFPLAAVAVVGLLGLGALALWKLH